MSIDHRPDPNSFAGAEARRKSANARLERQVRMAQQPWGPFLLRIALTMAALFAAASAVAWLASLSRGY